VRPWLLGKEKKNEHETHACTTCTRTETADKGSARDGNLARNTIFSSRYMRPRWHVCSHWRISQVGEVTPWRARLRMQSKSAAIWSFQDGLLINDPLDTATWIGKDDADRTEVPFALLGAQMEHDTFGALYTNLKRIKTRSQWCTRIPNELQQCLTPRKRVELLPLFVQDRKVVYDPCTRDCISFKSTEFIDSVIQELECMQNWCHFPTE
jgi:hypothetical protein